MKFSNYEFSKFLSIAFSKYYSSSEAWKLISNDFTQGVYKLVPKYNEYKNKANKAINESEIPMRGSVVAEKEFGVAKKLSDEWQSFVSKFSELEQVFEKKYKHKIMGFDAYMQDDRSRDEFLAEYSAYSFLESNYDSLARLGDDLASYEDKCLKSKDQSQPSSK